MEIATTDRFRTKFKSIFANLPKYLSQEELGSYTKLESQRHGKKHQDLYVFYLIKGYHSNRYVASYFNRSKSSIERSNRILEKLKLVRFNSRKYNPVSKRKPMSKIIEGANGLRKFRDEKKRAVRIKKEQIQKKYGNTIQNLANVKTNDENISGYYENLLEKFIPHSIDNELPNPNEAKRWKIYSNLAEEHTGLQKPFNPLNKKPKVKKAFREGYIKIGYDKDTKITKWLCLATLCEEHTQVINEEMVIVKYRVANLEYTENAEIPKEDCYGYLIKYKGEFGQLTEELRYINRNLKKYMLFITDYEAYRKFRPSIRFINEIWNSNVVTRSFVA